MNLSITELLSINTNIQGTLASDNGEFSSMLESAIAQRISDSSAASEDSESQATNDNALTLLDMLWEHKRHCRKNERPESPTPEELKAVARARARRKARLDAYFHLLERVCIKRKLIEQENAKRAYGKRYRSVTELSRLTQSCQLTAPPRDPNYFF